MRRRFALRKEAHKTLDRVTRAIAELRFNSAVAFIYSLTNLLETAVRDAKYRRHFQSDVSPPCAKLRIYLSILLHQ